MVTLHVQLLACKHKILILVHSTSKYKSLITVRERGSWWQSRMMTQALLTPWIQTDHYQIILNIWETDLQTGKTTSTSKGREGAAWRKCEARSAEAQFGRETTRGHWGGKGATITEKDERHQHTGECRGDMNAHSSWCGRQEGWHFMSSCN